jgi:hypothetical protein
MADLTLLTPTRDRPLQFGLCERWIRQQDYPGTIQWIVVDDGDRPIRPTLGQLYLRRTPSSKVCTLPENLLEAMPHVASERLVLIEDDDYYSPGYLSLMVGLLKQHDLAGLSEALYYHLPQKKWGICGNHQHASLCNTAMRWGGEMRTWLEHSCRSAIQENVSFVDLFIWFMERRKIGDDRARDDDRRFFKRIRKTLISSLHSSAGIKGLPGRGGLGTGHTASGYSWSDPDMSFLRYVIGSESARVYETLPGVV